MSTTRVTIAALAALSFLVSAVAQAKPRNCLTKAEHTAEQEVRHGVRLREAAVACQEVGFSPEAVKMWQEIDQIHGSRFKIQTETRRKAFEREFEANSVTYLAAWDGRIVNHFRNLSVSDMHCADIMRKLKDVREKGYEAFKKQAVMLRLEVRMDYRTCK